MKARRLYQWLHSPWGGMLALLLTTALAGFNATATEVTTIAGGPTSSSDSTHGAGYVDGETAVASRFNGPMGMAFDSSGYLYVADYNNNAVRMLDIPNDETYTFSTNNHPVGVAIDQNDNIYVLNYGNGTNGTLVQYDVAGDIVATNATGLQFAGGVAVDFAQDLFVTCSNQVIQVLTGEPFSLYCTITDAGAMLKGIVVMDSGLLAVADYGRNGIYTINPVGGTVTSNYTGIAYLSAKLISGAVATNTGFNGAGDAFGTKTRAKFLQPFGLLSVGSDNLIVADAGNNRVKYVDGVGTVTNLYGVDSNYWEPAPTPGLWDTSSTLGPPSVLYSILQQNYNVSNNVEARLPMGLAMDLAGTLYASEDYYHVIRTITAANLPPTPAPPPQVPAPRIGIVTFVYNDSLKDFISTFNPIANGATTNLYNDAIIVIWGADGAETYYNSTNSYPVTVLADPTINSQSIPYTYVDGVPIEKFNNGSMFSTEPHLTIKAISAEFGARNSEVASAHINFITLNPFFNGVNAANFILGDGTTGSTIYYTTDGSDPNPTNSLTTLISDGITPISLSLTGSNLLVKAQAFRAGFVPSQVVSYTFSSASYVPNNITFGFNSGEASSAFIASPGQLFYAPVTLSILPNTKMYSLQFALVATNAGPNPGPALVPSTNYLDFVSNLEEPDTANPGFFTYIPPAMFVGEVPSYLFYTNVVISSNTIPPYTNYIVITNTVFQFAQNPPPTNQIFYYNGLPFVPMAFLNTNENLVGLGWFERSQEKNLYNTKAQDLITYSQAHDIQYSESGGKVEVGDYAVLMPSNAVANQTYQIQIIRPSATSDGIGAPGSDVAISAPTNGSLTVGAINALKIITIGQVKYLAGDCYPFRWFNAGDFGDNNLDNADAMQVFQSAIYSVNSPPQGSDFFDSMDSCGGTYVDNGHGYLEASSTPISTNTLNSLFDGNDTNINSIAFGDGNLDVCDVYVTFRRSLDPSLYWFQRFWTNGVRVAQIVPNVIPHAAIQKPAAGSTPKPQGVISSGQPKVNFSAADFQVTPGQTVTVPITAQVFGSYPLRVLALNLSVEALDGSPVLTSQVQFTPNSVLGAPTLSLSQGVANYSGAWLNPSISGFVGTTVIGTLSITIPATATSQSSYAIHFDHASASPNGLASFPKTVYTGLITLSSRTNSSYNDGIPDSWRLRWFGTINNFLSASNADACGDGIDNWQKYIAGTDPTDPKAYPHLLPKSVPSGSNSAIHWPTVSGKQYVIERSFNLYGGWSPVSTNTGTGTDMEFDDTVGSGVRFYRVQILP